MATRATAAARGVAGRIARRLATLPLIISAILKVAEEASAANFTLATGLAFLSIWLWASRDDLPTLLVAGGRV